MPGKRYLTAEEAADALDISKSTLYAYVSRGLIRSEATGGSKRTRRYHAEDIDRLLLKKAAAKNPEVLTDSALHWGSPVLESAITLIRDGTLYYRGETVTALPLTHPFEGVAALLWGMDADAAASLFTDVPDLYSQVRALATGLTDYTPLVRMQTLLPIAAAQDFAAYDLRPDAVAQSGARILRLLVDCVVGAMGDSSDESLVRRLTMAWGLDSVEADFLLNAALILCADHELNASSFTARIVASTGAAPYAVVMAGLAALTGVKHGGSTARVDAFLNDISAAQSPQAGIAARLQRGDSIPGFGHMLYHDGDPRARVLLDALADSAWAEVYAPFATICDAAAALIGEQPNIDFGLVVLARCLSLPPHSPITLFALGRTTGWIAHAIEQYQSDTLIRPRARYTGVEPDEG